MKSPLALPPLLLSVCFAASAPAQETSMLPANARVAVIGDSITEHHASARKRIQPVKHTVKVAPAE